jgi:hypothetical protein
MLLIGKPIERENAQATLAWEMAEQLKLVDAAVFANVTQKNGEELYKASREKSAIVVQKLSATAKEDDVVKFYLDHYSIKATVHAKSMTEMYGHFSIFLSGHPFAACILYVRERKGDAANVVCIVSGRDRPSYIFSARAGTLEKSNYLYGSMMHAAPAGSILSGYIVSGTAPPIAVEQTSSPKKMLLEEETPKIKTSAKKKKRIKKEPLEEEKEEEEKTSPQKKRIKEESPEEEKEEEEEKPKKKVVRRAKLGKDAASKE